MDPNRAYTSSLKVYKLNNIKAVSNVFSHFLILLIVALLPQTLKVITSRRERASKGIIHTPSIIYGPSRTGDCIEQGQLLAEKK